MFVSVAISPYQTQSASHRTKNLDVARISTCHVAPLVNTGAVEAHVTSWLPTRVPVAFVMFAPNLDKYTHDVALVPENLIP